jgi:hypothetical protein
MSKKKWDPWRTDWCWVQLPEEDPFLLSPAPCSPASRSGKRLTHDDELSTTMEHIQLLHDQGTMAHHVITAFL